jgi:hypothetical protein
MKKLIFTFLLILPMSIVGIGNTLVARGQSNSDFGDYTITKLEEHLTLNGKEMDKYLISYERPDRKVIVAIDKQKKCKMYYVFTGQLAVQYKCNGKLFGIMKLDKSFRNKGFATTSENLNKQEFAKQKVVTGGTTKTIDHLNLIASCYPRLINQNPN